MRKVIAAFLAFLTLSGISPDALAQTRRGKKDKTGASSEARDRALDLFKQSETSYQAGRFDEAARLLEEAYALQPEPVLLYNLARAYEGMGESEKAVDAYKRFLEGAPDAKDRGAIERRVQTLEKQIAEQKRLAEERRRLAAERDKPREPEPEPKPAPSAGPGIWPWVTAGVGVALIGTGAVFGVMAQSKRDDADEDPEHRSASETFREAESMATTANVLFIVGGIVTAGGVTWIVLSQGSKSERAALELGVGPGSVRVGGRW